MHIGVIGVGNVGRSTAFSILLSRIADELSLVDIKPGLAYAIAEEFKHAAAGYRIDTEINWFERDEELSGADIVIVTAGTPRTPGVRISRRELAAKNAKIVKYIAEVVPPNNRGAKYVIVTNPVDAMASLFKLVSKEDFVISTGNHLETLRFRARISELLKAKPKEVAGFVGGEHGKQAHILWSTVRISGHDPEIYAKQKGINFSKEAVESYMKEAPEKIIDYAGATRFGPAAAFTEILRSIAWNENKVLSIATPRKFPNIHGWVHVSVPTIVGRVLGRSLYEELTEEEKNKIHIAAQAIFETFCRAVKTLQIDYSNCSY
ncbi:MAG: malate dehydrogenase [Thermoprotei archaeon]|nr:MAG: malate dehydrogenase [Thermoprotei archaeon]